MSIKFINAAETARIIRYILKKSFPGVKFSVRSRSFSQGCAVDISWHEGPTWVQVEAVTGLFDHGKKAVVNGEKVFFSPYLSLTRLAA